jgi:hypothetical protein
VSELFYSLAILACPVAMGLMMWFMMRGMNNQPAAAPAPADDVELSRMRAEIDQLRAAQRDSAAHER